MFHHSSWLFLAVFLAAQAIVTTGAQTLHNNPVLSGTWTQTIETAEVLFGTWKLNVAKSRFEPGPAPTEITRIYEDRGNGIVLVSVSGVDAQGAKTFNQTASKYDGKDYPTAVKGSQTANTTSITAVDPLTGTYVQKADGRITSTGRRTLSEDGNTLTLETRGTDAQGQPTSSLQVFEKVAPPAMR